MKLQAQRSGHIITQGNAKSKAQQAEGNGLASAVAPYDFLLSDGHISPRPLFGRHFVPRNRYLLEVAYGAKYVKIKKQWINYSTESKSRGKRSAIEGFTDDSRKRLRDLFAKINTEYQEKYSGNKGISVTLTYPGEYDPDPNTWKKHLDNFGKSLRREYKESSCIWVLEFQKRGAPHFHVCVLGVNWIPYKWVNDTWKRIICNTGYARTETRAIRKNIMNYFSKYMSKEQGTEDYVGRYWGVIGRENLPVVMLIMSLKEEEFFRYRRVMIGWLERKLGRKIRISDNGLKTYMRSETGIKLYFFVLGIKLNEDNEP